MKRYAIWNKQDMIITPIGEVLTAEQWIERYPAAGVPSITVVCSAGEINGGFFGTLGQMVKMAENEGWDFSACTNDEEKLACYEAWEDSKNTPSMEPTNEDMNAASLASIAASLEFQNMMSLPDEEV